MNEEYDIYKISDELSNTIKSLESILEEMKQSIKKECIVCFSEYLCIYDKEGNMASIHDCEDSIPDNKVFLSCCLKEEHFLCKNCLRTIALNFSNHVINKNNSLIFCPSIEDCITPAGIKNYFDHNLVRKVLTEEEFNLYMNHAQRFVFTGYEIVKCKRCSIDNVIPEDYFKDADIGRLLIRCSQSRNCNAVFCYTCLSDVNPYRNSCPECESKTENTNYSSFNRYFYKPFEFRQEDSETEEKYFFRNKELTNKIILSQLQEIIENSYIRCPICLVKMYKTEKCNTMDHCNTESCYACNRKTYGKLEDHWSEVGKRGCYRFDSATLIKDFVPEFICLEEICYNHDKGDCKNEQHQEGIQSLENFRKAGNVYHMLKSLVCDKRDEILNIINEEKKYENILSYLPYSFDYEDYKDYLPLKRSKLQTYNRYSLLENEETREHRDITEINVESTPLLQRLPQVVVTPENVGNWGNILNRGRILVDFRQILSNYRSLLESPPSEQEDISDAETLFNEEEE